MHRAKSETGPIFLVGMMGAGKSTAGRALAERLGRPFVDTDGEIERETGLSIAALFAVRGEPTFRTLERRVIERAAKTGSVVALGGGAIAQPGVADLLRRRGTVVYLRAKPATLATRIGDAADRPLLAGLDADARVERLAELLRERMPHYESSAIRIDTDALDAAASADAIAAALAAPGEADGAPVRNVTVPLGDRAYAIRIGTGILDHAGAAIAEATKARRVAIVTVPAVGRRYGPALERSLRAAGVKSRRLVVPDGERSKNLRVAARLFEALVDFDADRGTAIVALGGGS
jgi:shikimate kinase